MAADRGPADDLVRIVRRRADIVGALTDGPMGKRDLEEAADCSRSTINRAVAELDAHGLIRRSDGGYVATAYGCSLVRAHRNYLDTLEQVVDAREVLVDANDPVEFPPALVDGADVHSVDPSAPFRTQRRIAELVEGATRLRAAIPSLQSPRQLSVCQDLVDDGADLTLLVTPTLLDLVTEEFDDRLRALARTDRVTVAVGDCPWFPVRVVERPERVTAAVTVRSPEGAPTGVVVNDEPAAVAWAIDLFEAHLADAEDVTDRLRGAGAVESPPAED